MFGTYLPDDIPIVSSVIAVCLADTAISLLAGLVIFPVEFANHFTPDSGPSLIFQILSLDFNQIPFGNFFRALFFVVIVRFFCFHNFFIRTGHCLAH